MSCVYDLYHNLILAFLVIYIYRYRSSVLKHFPIENGLRFEAKGFSINYLNYLLLLILGYFSNVFQPPTMPSTLPPPIRVRVRVQEDVFLIPVPQRLIHASFINLNELKFY